MDDAWRTAEADRDVQLLLSAHDHDYERFEPLDAAGAPSATGLPSTIVGTGGKSLYCERTTGGPAATEGTGSGTTARSAGAAPSSASSIRSCSLLVTMPSTVRQTCR